MPQELKSLSDLKVGTHALVNQILGGRGLYNRLLILGFTIGVEVGVLQNCSQGPVIVSVRDSRIALGRKEAEKLIVEILH